MSALLELLLVPNFARTQLVHTHVIVEVAIALMEMDTPAMVCVTLLTRLWLSLKCIISSLWSPRPQLNINFSGAKEKVETTYFFTLCRY